MSVKDKDEKQNLTNDTNGNEPINLEEITITTTANPILQISQEISNLGMGKEIIRDQTGIKYSFMKKNQLNEAWKALFLMLTFKWRVKSKKFQE